MSRVIKAAIWEENPHLIHTPEPPKPEEKAAEDNGLDEEACARMLAEIAAKEQRAIQLLKDAKVDAEIIKQEAKAERDRYLAEAQKEIDQKKEEAAEIGRQEGYEAGYKDGEAKVREELADIIAQGSAQAEKTLQDAKAACKDYVQQAEADVVKIAMAVVEKILPQHFIDVPQVVLPLVRESLLKVKDQKTLKVHVSPADYDLVLMARTEFRGLLTYGDAEIDITSDPSMKPGDCLIETPNGTVDARLATQIELVRQAVKNVML
ncbi:putative flagellar assembly protein FliH [Selenomonas ruminantium subsp. lactilytica TAM6421]|uniref:Putative flagellar assembly protein FliH n=1 Tax=Selenomonas ruminantium subsp. lactilytica (strain NBRC 103574 / TAM6421) TaxID=927704 RepID=I0GNB0_SELRL|nr:FliH/SctL family protein [Selenomonas ruminantium]BAL82247.1 putative flagellar assembly protein FliH [Selenomonas ruminantium subsp. lactilytica TAM6421]